MPRNVWRYKRKKDIKEKKKKKKKDIAGLCGILKILDNRYLSPKKKKTLSKVK